MAQPQPVPLDEPREFEQERHEYAAALAASGISNAEFHRALEEFDRDEARRETTVRDSRTGRSQA